MSNNLLIKDRRFYEGIDLVFDDLRKSGTLVAVFAGPDASIADVSLNASLVTSCAAYDSSITSVYVHAVMSVIRVDSSGIVTFVASGTANDLYSLSGGVLTQETGTDWSTYTYIVIFRGDLQ